MNKDYYLNEEHLNTSIIFSGFLYDTFNNKPKIEIRKLWDSKLFDNILKLQPELQNKYEEFWINFDNEKKKNVYFSKIFKGLIKLENFIPIFEVSYTYNGGESNRVRIFKELHKETENFLPFLHKYLLKNNSVKSDSSLYDTYFQLIKNNLPLFNKEEVLQIIGDYKVGGHTQSIKRKMNAYMLFDKDEYLYKTIMSNMGEIFNENAEISNIFKEKLLNFSPEIQKQYQSAFKNKAILSEEESYHYQCDFNKDYMIEYSKKSTKEISEFKILLNKSIYNLVKKHNSEAIFNKNINVAQTLDFDIKTIEQREWIKLTCQNLASELDTLLTIFPWEESYSNKINYLEEYVEKTILKISLEQNLEEKTNMKKLKI